MWREWHNVESQRYLNTTTPRVLERGDVLQFSDSHVFSRPRGGKHVSLSGKCCTLPSRPRRPPSSRGKPLCPTADPAPVVIPRHDPLELRAKTAVSMDAVDLRGASPASGEARAPQRATEWTRRPLPFGEVRTRDMMVRASWERWTRELTLRRGKCRRTGADCNHLGLFWPHVAIGFCHCMTQLQGGEPR